MLESPLKKKSQGHLLEIFPIPDSKSLRLRYATFETQLSRGINVPQLSALKQSLVCSEKVRKRSFTSHRIFSKRRKR